MKVEVTHTDMAVIKRNTKALLMLSNRRIYVIDAVTFEEGEKTVKKLFSKPVVEKTNYLVELKVYGYNPKGKFLGELSDEAAIRLVTRYDLDALRNKWRSFKEELEAFGFEIVKKTDKVDN